MLRNRSNWRCRIRRSGPGRPERPRWSERLGEEGRGILHAGRFRHARTGVEIKARATVTAPDFAALQALRGQLGEWFQAGIVLYLGEHVVSFGDKTWLAPLPTLWEP